MLQKTIVKPAIQILKGLISENIIPKNMQIMKKVLNLLNFILSGVIEIYYYKLIDYLNVLSLVTQNT